MIDLKEEQLMSLIIILLSSCSIEEVYSKIKKVLRSLSTRPLLRMT
jgi:hypothetical protein